LITTEIFPKIFLMVNKGEQRWTGIGGPEFAFDSVEVNLARLGSLEVSWAQFGSLVAQLEIVVAEQWAHLAHLNRNFFCK
jgi:hypothetical protein